MPSRRISSNDNLAVVQEISVQPFSSYNSDNVNMLSRMITGDQNKDCITKGLDVKGLNRVNTEVLDPSGPITNETFTATPYTFNTFWTNTYFSWYNGISYYAAKGSINGSDISDTVILQSLTQPSLLNIGFWFKIQFELRGTPKQLFIQYGSESKTFDHPTSGTYTFYIQLYNNADTFEALKFIGFLDTQDIYSDTSFSLTNIILTKVINKGIDIEPIALPPAESPDTTTSAVLDSTDIPLNMIHPHESVKVFPGVCVKDEATINIMGLNPSDTDTPVLTLDYSDPTSWIKGVPFGASDFPAGQLTYYITDGGAPTSTTYDASGNLLITLQDDGENPGHYTKINGQSDAHTDPAYTQWAYIVLYYSYFKNPNPNKSYIGLAKLNEINDARYGDDYLILAKLRFVDVKTVDAIVYYPERQDWQFIDATKISYLYLNQLKHWLDKPVNVSLALDLLASRIYNFKGVLFFATHQQFNLWKSTSPTGGVGHGPDNFLQWLNGADPDNEYDLLAFVSETNTFWRSRIRLTGIITSVDVISGGSGYLTDPTINIKWAEGETGTSPVLVPIRTGNVLTSIAVTSGGTGFLTVPDLIISNATGSGAIVKANIGYTTTNYKVTVDWIEITQKRFEVDWTNLNTGSWPSSIPGSWNWYGYPTTPPTTLSDVQAAWPNGYYYVGGSEGTTKINPFNSTGRGLISAPFTDDVANGNFLRADGTWHHLVVNKLSFYIQGYLVEGAQIAEAILATDTIFNNGTVGIDTLPIGADLIIKFYRKYSISGGAWIIDSSFASVTFSNGASIYEKAITFNSTPIIATGEILLIKCFQSGISPNEGGADTKITIYQL